MRQPIIIARDANGLYVNARNNAYLLAIVKIALSIFLVQKLGLLGVVMATTIAYWGIDFTYNPGLVYKNVFHRSVKDYYFMVLNRLAVAGVIGAFGFVIWNRFFAASSVTVVHLILNIVLLGILIAVITTIVYWLLYRSFRNLYVRLKGVLARRRQQKEKSR